jgi:YbgC/YbaW family acyl-CoA thioester hydrolase
VIDDASPRHVSRSRVAWIDTDAGGRIHFTAAFRWAEAAETALLRSLGLLDDWSDYPRRAVEAEYLAVLRFEDEFEVELTLEKVGTSSITYGWEIRRPDGEVCIRGRHTAVHVDADGRPAPLSPKARRLLAGSQP